MSELKLAILIVDDEPVVRDSLVHWFTEEGYDVDSAESATDALSKLAGREFDLVVADIRMPGMDGIELLEKIKSEGLDRVDGEALQFVKLVSGDENRELHVVRPRFHAACLSNAYVAFSHVSQSRG